MTQGKKVLIAEDDFFTRIVMGEIVNALECDAQIVASGQECCRALEENPDMFGLVLIDIHMPEMSGIDATKKIRESAFKQLQDIPIYAVTGDQKYQEQSVVAACGMNGFFVKPVTAVELNTLLYKYCKTA